MTRRRLTDVYKTLTVELSPSHETSHCCQHNKYIETVVDQSLSTYFQRLFQRTNATLLMRRQTRELKLLLFCLFTLNAINWSVNVVVQVRMRMMRGWVIRRRLVAATKKPPPLSMRCVAVSKPFCLQMCILKIWDIWAVSRIKCSISTAPSSSSWASERTPHRYSIHLLSQTDFRITDLSLRVPRPARSKDYTCTVG
jgi:hypothetical protein